MTTLSPPQTESQSPDTQVLFPEARQIERRRRLRLTSFVVLTLAIAIVVVMSFSGSPTKSIPPTRSSSAPSTVLPHGPYSIGSPIAALKLSRLQMLNSKDGVGVVPITTLSGVLVSSFLVRTSDAGATWRVTGIIPKGSYPWSTAFVSPKVGYLLTSGTTLFTNNAGRTWSKVTVSGSPLSISINGNVAWIEVENCPAQGPDVGVCTHLDAYSLGSLKPSSIEPVPSDQAQITQLTSTSGYAISNASIKSTIAFTSNAGESWRAVPNPCARFPITDSSVASLAKLFVYCQLGTSSNPGPVVLYSSIDAGSTWSRVSFVEGSESSTASGTSGRFLWRFDNDAKFWISSDGGRDWSQATGVKYGVSGGITTYGAVGAWHAYIGHGIYRTLNGTRWVLLK
jgi:photosystem II stability/assembly factor-like uncharacterized protein